MWGCCCSRLVGSEAHLAVCALYISKSLVVQEKSVMTQQLTVDITVTDCALWQHWAIRRQSCHEQWTTRPRKCWITYPFYCTSNYIGRITLIQSLLQFRCYCCIMWECKLCSFSHFGHLALIDENADANHITFIIIIMQRLTRHVSVIMLTNRRRGITWIYG